VGPPRPIRGIALPLAYLFVRDGLRNVMAHTD
jgi:hypothetical protein